MTSDTVQIRNYASQTEVVAPAPLNTVSKSHVGETSCGYDHGQSGWVFIDLCDIFRFKVPYESGSRNLINVIMELCNGR